MSYPSEYSSDSDNEYEVCGRNGKCGLNGQCGIKSTALPFDPTSLEQIILKMSDKFNFRVLMNNSRVRKAMLVTSGLAIAGGLIGNHYGGKMGAAVGGAVGGACGVGIVALSMREVWEEIKPKLSDLYDLVYDYLVGLGFADYNKAIQFVMKNSGNQMQLATLVIHVASDLLGQKILSSITAS